MLIVVIKPLVIHLKKVQSRFRDNEDGFLCVPDKSYISQL